MYEIRKDREIEQLLQETLLLWGEIAEAVSNSSPSHGELRQFCNETMHLLDRSMIILGEWDANEEAARKMLEKEWLGWDGREVTRNFSQKETAANKIWFKNFSKLRTIFKEGQISEEIFKSAVICLDNRRLQMCKRIKFFSVTAFDKALVLHICIVIFACCIIGFLSMFVTRYLF
jgi:hypothetical protein